MCEGRPSPATTAVDYAAATFKEGSLCPYCPKMKCKRCGARISIPAPASSEQKESRYGSHAPSPSEARQLRASYKDELGYSDRPTLVYERKDKEAAAPQHDDSSDSSLQTTAGEAAASSENLPVGAAEPSPPVGAAEPSLPVNAEAEPSDLALSPDALRRGSRKSVMLAALGLFSLLATATYWTVAGRAIDSTAERSQAPAGGLPAATHELATPAKPKPCETASDSATLKVDEVGPSAVSKLDKKLLTDLAKVPAGLYAPSVLHQVYKAMRRAEQCHPEGRVTGDADVIIDFGPDGLVRDARVVGEPVASAPVAHCILAQARAVRISRFEGPPFTLRQSITLGTIAAPTPGSEAVVQHKAHAPNQGEHDTVVDQQGLRE